MPTRVSRRRLVQAGALLAMGPGALVAPRAQDAWPSRPIRMVVGFAADSSTDIVARLLEPSMTRALGQPVVVDNRAGAVGVVGAEAVKRAAPMRYTRSPLCRPSIRCGRATPRSRCWTPAASWARPLSRSARWRAAT